MGKELKNEFSWSKTRDQTFRECLRKYYFQYYGGWGGWLKDADPRIRQIYMLKNLYTRQMWAGDHVHLCLEKVLGVIRRGLEAPAEDEAVRNMTEDMRRDFKDSRAGKYRQDPKRICGLFEHEYALEISDEAWKAIAEHADKCVRHFYRAPVFQKLRERPAAAWLEIEERSTFQLDGLKVYVQLDCAFRLEDGIVIYDWKTGKIDAERNDVQLACYILYAMEKWKATAEQVTAIDLYLTDGSESPRQLDAERLEDAKNYIRDSADEMLFPLSDPERNFAEEDAFDFTDNESACRRCNFLKVCPKWQS
jgi:hypothetical protein